LTRVSRSQAGSLVHPQKRTLAWIVSLGGAGVLASYACSLGVGPATRAGLWGGVPSRLIPAYVASMVLATGGFFAFTFFFWRLGPDGTQIAGQFGFSLFSGLYVVILVPSALWLPLTSAMVEQPSRSLWLGIQLVLALVALGSVALLMALLSLRPRQPATGYWFAVVGALAFCIQTVVLDLGIWTSLFPA
jgi:hypothetical protein